MALDSDSDSEETTRSGAKRPPPDRKDHKEWVERFKLARQWAWKPGGRKDGKNFNVDTMTRESMEHNKKFEIYKHPVNTKHPVGGDECQVHQKITIKKVATFNENFFFCDPLSGIEGDVFSVSSKEQAEEMERRGYKRFAVTHIMDMGSLPYLPTRRASSVEQKETEDVVAMAGPSELTLPREIPFLFKADDSTTAEAIVHSFEVKVYDAATRRAYSPYRLWSPEVRKGVKMERSRLTKYFQCYYTIRELKKDVAPSAIKDGMNALAKLATRHFKQNETPPDWYELAVSAMPQSD